MYACITGPHCGKCYPTTVFRTLPANSNPELIEKQDGMPANFQMPVSLFLFMYDFFITLPADSTPELIEKQARMPANFKTFSDNLSTQLASI